VSYLDQKMIKWVQHFGRESIRVRNFKLRQALARKILKAARALSRLQGKRRPRRRIPQMLGNKWLYWMTQKHKKGYFPVRSIR